MNRDRVTVRLVNNHPAASPGRREYVTFKNIQRKNVVFCIAAAQISLHGQTSMFRYEQQYDGRWVRIGPETTEKIRAEIKRLAERWHPLDELSWDR